MLAACAGAAPVWAGVRVGGGAEGISIDATQARVAEILSALAESGTLRYRAAVPLDTVISGSYHGSVAKVLPHLLDGYNYVIKNSNAVTELIIYGKRSERGAPESTPAPASLESPARDWGQRKR
jgi:hypothetical protein